MSVDSRSRLQTERLTEPRESRRDDAPHQPPMVKGGAVSRHRSDVVYLLLRVGLLRKSEFSPTEQRVVFRFGQLTQDETVAVAVDLLDLDRLVRLFQAAQADAKARGYIADAITRTVTKPSNAATDQPAPPDGRSAR